MLPWCELWCSIASIPSNLCECYWFRAKGWIYPIQLAGGICVWTCLSCTASSRKQYCSYTLQTLCTCISVICLSTGIIIRLWNINDIFHNILIGSHIRLIVWADPTKEPMQSLFFHHSLSLLLLLSWCVGRCLEHMVHHWYFVSYTRMYLYLIQKLIKN